MILQSLIGAAGSPARIRAILFRTAGPGMALAILIILLGIPTVGMAKGKPRPPPEPPPAEPPARFWHAFTGNGSRDLGSSRLFLLGGNGDASANYEAFADFWFYAVESRQWVLAPTGRSQPGKRAHAGLSCGSGECVTSNGVNVGYLAETWVYAENPGVWTKINCRKQLCPSARSMVTMAYDPDRYYHVLFGGEYGKASLGDTWSFAGGNWTREYPASSPPARRWAAMTHVDSLVNGLVLFGGLNGSISLFDDMWVWDGYNWQPVAVSGGPSPPSLYGHSMAWDGDRLLVTGGYVDLNETPSYAVWTFTFDGARSGKWSKEPDASGCYASIHPGARMAYDRSQKLKVFFGGLENGPNGAIAYDDTVICN